MAGYSKRPLVAKLGIKTGSRVYWRNPPADFRAAIGTLPEGIVLLPELDGEPCDFIHFFTKEKAELEADFPPCREALKKDGMLWISWPKKASKVETDLDENIVRAIGLKNGMVDIKVCAVDDIWSGLKFVYRLQDR